MFRKSTPQVLGRAVLAGVLGLVASGAIAADTSSLTVSAEGTTRSVKVRIADLDLASTSGQARLESRINDAARRACDIHAGSAIDTGPLAKACFAQARSGALAQLETRGLAVPARLAMNTAR
ncbi:MAG: hypothetical protein B7Z08_03955 [Sphingomonadales bacterium 32-68-7]|nr:MAG: hypothetical protein B7Z33_13860 [Sphingomonadales bacterium 12-68-11]OYX09691.1 MAG: hypothetical protein B7Z08_03955 [Sphingomonadales bacterium 32-68-7]